MTVKLGQIAELQQTGYCEVHLVSMREHVADREQLPITVV